MRILFDITHPAHVHLFRHSIDQLDSDGHEVYVMSREKDITTELLNAYRIDHCVLSQNRNGLTSLLSEWIKREVKTVQRFKSLKPDIVVSRFNPAATHASTLLGIPHLVFDDTEDKPKLIHKFTNIFANAIYTPDCYNLELGKNQHRYPGYHELAYLHPNRFSPNKSRLRSAGIDPDETYAVIRFIGWEAIHDIGEKGLSLEAKNQIVDLFTEQAKVYITSESNLPNGFREYKLDIPPHLIHDLLAFSDYYIGESGTMATEAAILGVPSIRITSVAKPETNSGVHKELENKYKLLYSTPNECDAINQLESLIEATDINNIYQQRRQDLLDDKIDVTEFIVKEIQKHEQ